MVSVFKGPKSFTAEDVVEISTHGGVLVTQAVLNRLLELNIEMAKPGEFTERAYLNGRIDLVQAEAIMDLIEAKNDSAMKIANYALNKTTSKLVEDFLDKILKLIASIEVNIDYPEYDDAVVMTNDLIKPVVVELLDEIEELIKNSEKTKLIKDGIQTAIVGRPNVGKSSLLNALIQEDRAIVTNVAGTTRDTIEARLNLGGITLNLVDTAGIRDTEDVVESIGVDRSLKALKDSDLVLLVLDQSLKLTDEDLDLLKLTENKNRILIGNKSDLGQKLELDDIISISSLKKEGLDELEKAIIKKLSLEEVETNDLKYLSNVRQINKMKEARQSLQDAFKAIVDELPVDLIVVDLTNAYYRLGEILGVNFEPDIVGKLFREFCLGK